MGKFQEIVSEAVKESLSEVKLGIASSQIDDAEFDILKKKVAELEGKIESLEASIRKLGEMKQEILDTVLREEMKSLDLLKSNLGGE